MTTETGPLGALRAAKARENLRKSVAQHVAKSGSGAVLVSACTIADLFADLDAAIEALATPGADVADVLDPQYEAGFKEGMAFQEKHFAATPAPVAMGEWVNLQVTGLSDLVEALDRAERKGYMPDALQASWEAFDYRVAHTPAPVAVESVAVGKIVRVEGHWDRGHYFDTPYNEVVLLKAGKKLPHDTELFTAPQAAAQVTDAALMKSVRKAMSEIEAVKNVTDEHTKALLDTPLLTLTAALHPDASTPQEQPND